MTYLKKIASACAVAAAVTAGSATAAPIVLDFEGIADFASINDFYNGGTDSNGATGTDYGVSFSADSIVLTDSDAGGFGPNGGMSFGVGGLTFFRGGGAPMNGEGRLDARPTFHHLGGEAGILRGFGGQ